MTQEAYDEVSLGMVMANLKRIFGERDTISSKSGMCIMTKTSNHLNVKIGSDYAMSIPFRNIASIETCVSSERGYGVVIVNTKAGYAYSIKLDSDELDGTELVK